MKQFIVTILASFVIIVAFTQTKKDTDMIEKYNFEAVKKKEFLTKKGSWLIYISPMPGGFQNEYAPAIDFYKVQKQYHPNGVISSICKFLRDVPFGIMEFYNEQGELIKTVDEDKKFGKIKPENLVLIIEKVRWINRQTGENIFTKEPLKTDGSFYKELENHLTIQFVPASISKERKEIPPVWLFSYLHGMTQIYYSVNGNTGEYKYNRFERKKLLYR